MSESIDVAVIDQLRSLRLEDEADPVVEIIDLFLEDSTARIQTVLRAIESHEYRLAETTAHALKGGAANVGASALARLCRELIDLLRKGDFSPCPKLAADLIDEFERSSEILTTEKAN